MLNTGNQSRIVANYGDHTIPERIADAMVVPQTFPGSPNIENEKRSLGDCVGE